MVGLILRSAGAVQPCICGTDRRLFDGLPALHRQRSVN
jgi:hypothetical protein